MISRRLALAAFVAAASALAAHAAENPLAKGARAPPPPASEDRPLTSLIDGPQRSAANKARDAWRHPLDSLTFWGLQPGLTVLEIDPGGGYWTEIMAPFVNSGGGRYIAGLSDPDAPNLSEGARKGRAAFLARYADKAVYGPIDTAVFSGSVGLVAPAGSVDLILIARNIHNLMWSPGALDRALAGFYAALRPGGVLAVEEHRADPRVMIADARDGYVSEASVIAAAAKAGFVLDARSEVNANPKDSKDHPFGVWTLPPTRQSAPNGQPPDPAFNHAKYDAIGESDRMTLRFRKPG
jgi:predicted methyltransferase